MARSWGNVPLKYDSAAGGGGYINTKSGAGTDSDKAIWGYYQPNIGVTRQILETVYTESWVAKKIIDIPVDDALSRWRSWDVDDDEGVVERMQEAETDLMLRQRVARAMKSARLYGTGMILIVTKSAPLEEPLDYDALREGDLSNLLVLSRYDAEVSSRIIDIYDPDFGRPETYRLTYRGLDHLSVHASRVLRFEGIEPITGMTWEQYDQDWGVSELQPLLTLIVQEAELISGVATLATEASLPVMKLAQLREALAGQADPDRAAPEEVLRSNLAMKSIYRTLVVDSEDEFERVAVSFAGLPELMDRYARRLAAAADIPATRFWAQSPIGLNATGDSDAGNYALAVEAMQRRMISPVLDKLDRVIAAHAGIAEPPEYRWLSLLEMSEAERSANAKTKIEMVVAAVQGGLIDEYEGRAILTGDEVIGDLEDDPDWLAEQEEEMALEPLQMQPLDAPPMGVAAG